MNEPRPSTGAPMDAPMDAVDVFTEVCRAVPAEREPLLARLCGANEALRERLRRMLEAFEAREAESSGSDELPDLRPGGILAERYELLSEIGRGATASVWRAVDRRMTREVALKIFRRSVARRGWEQVVAEARAVANVYSDHVVRVHTVGEPTDEHLFIDLELCCEFEQGETIAAQPLSRVAPRSLDEAVLWLEQAARGIEAAHQKNVFHRDVKPDNMLVELRSRWLRVTDFGHGVQRAAATHSREPASPGSATVVLEHRGGEIIGTPPFMAPEQAAGLTLDPANPAHQPALRRIDVFGLGATAYYVLSGRAPHPWTADKSAREVIEEVTASPPPELRARKGFRIPARLRRIVERAMARDPAARYATPGELASDLRAFREDRCPSHDRRRYALRSMLWVRRHKVAVTNAALLCVFAGAVYANSVWQARALQSLSEMRRAQVDAASAKAEAADALASAKRAHAEALDAEARQRTAERGTAEARAQQQRAERAAAAAEVTRAEALAAAAAAKSKAAQDAEARAREEALRREAEAASAAARASAAQAEAAKKAAEDDRDQRVAHAVARQKEAEAAKARAELEAQQTLVALRTAEADRDAAVARERQAQAAAAREEAARKAAEAERDEARAARAAGAAQAGAVAAPPSKQGGREADAG